MTLSNGYASTFVTVGGHKLYRQNAPYYFVGTNYWYGSLLGLEKDKKRGVERLRRELDFLKANGVTNLRLLAGAEGSGLLNAVTRVGPPLQPEMGKFDESILEGLDLVLYEMGKRRMTAVIFFSNNWEWSGGFQQYLIWNGIIPDKWLTKKPTWDELRDIVAKFYSCEPCKDGYNRQVKLVLNRKNRYSGKAYISDPTIMAWELANEPRPMRPAANGAYRMWVAETAALIRSIDKNHLITTGHEGWIGIQDIRLFETIHADKNIDYLTIHIWPKNWGWFGDKRLAEDFPKAVSETEKYISENLAVAVKLDKPLVIEEFGMPRDGQSFSIASTTSIRDSYYKKIFSYIGNQAGGKPQIAGANFWAFGGSARPINGQPFWKTGDELMGDPPMEEQGLNSVFDTDRTTWAVIRSVGKKAAQGSK
ncbi:MAG: cellulase family glycosylhydrolase [Pyrinomonadaceae bacterium]